MERYEKIDRLGEGAYAVVYKGQDKQSHNFVALKRIPLDSEEEGVPCTALREISLLKELRHPNIIRLLDVLHSERKLTLVFEFGGQNLREYLNSCKGAPDATIAKSFLHQLLSGVAFCHERKVLHRDLKPQNLLVSADLQLRLADFGLARTFGIPVRSFSHEVVTLWYRAPDVLLGSNQYTTSIDLWSVGCIFAEMSTGTHALFPSRNTSPTPLDQLDLIFQLLGTPTVATWPAMAALPEYHGPFPVVYAPQPLESKVPHLEAHGVDLLARMLVFDADSRISAADALQHLYFESLKI